MSKKTIKYMTAAEAFSKLLDNMDNGLNLNLRRVWKHRHGKGQIRIEKIEYQLKKFGYRELAPDAWV